MTFTQTDLIRIARDLLTEDPAPAVRVHLYREVLGLDETDAALVKAKEALHASPGVQELAREQWPDGSWGRLHSRDSAAKQKILTTEMGVGRALALGLTADHAVLQKAANRLKAILSGETVPRDRAERNPRWPVGVQLFAAATLAMIQPAAPEVDDPFTLWIELAQRAFASGAYSSEAEDRAHQALTGAPVRESYLTLNNRYTLTLLSARPEALPAGLEAKLVHWLWGLPQGMKYLPAALRRPPELHRPGAVEPWFAAQEVMSRFPSWGEISSNIRTWLWELRDAKGGWDFGKRGSTSVVLPLAEHWRRPCTKRQDWTARMIMLLYRETPAAPRGP